MGYPTRLMKIILIIILILVMLGIAWYYQIQRQRLLQDVEAVLTIPLQQRIAEIHEWRSLLLDEASIELIDQYNIPLFSRWLQNPPNQMEIDSLAATLHSTQLQYQYKDVLFVGPSGEQYFRLNKQAGGPSEINHQAVAEAFRAGKAILTKLYLDSADGIPQIDQVIPFFTGRGDAAKPIGAVIYQYNVEPLFNPILQTSPPAGRSAEFVFLRQDGESVLYLNKLRHHNQGSSYNLRTPLDRKDAITVKAVSGHRQLVEGRDYRDVKVLAVVLPVPGTDWLAIHKLDKAEAFTPLRQEFYIILAILFLLCVSFFSIIALLKSRRSEADIRSEEETRTRQSRYEAILDGITQGCQIIDFEWRYIFINAIAARYSGHTKDELMNHTIMELYPGFTKNHALSSPFIKCMNERMSQYFEIEMDNPDGTKGWYAYNIQPIPEGIFVLTNNITKRKKTEAENMRLVSAIEQSRELVVIFNEGGYIEYVNPAYLSVTGYEKDEVVGQLMPMVMHGSQDQKFYDDLVGTVRNGQTWRGRYINQKKDGTFYEEEAVTWPIKDKSGQITHFISVKHDISEYQKLEEEKEKLQSQLLQSQKMESIGRLAGGVAHDFNNMLSVILGHAQLSLDTLESGHPLFNDLQEINKAALRSAELTNQLLAFARKQTISPKVLNLNETIGGLLKMLQRLIHEGINLAWIPGYDIWPAKIDPSQINQILANLTINARDAIRTNGRITIETDNTVIDEAYCKNHPDAKPGWYIMLSVSDDGIGMDAETIGHIFEPFFTTKSFGKGTGLGLATVYGIVRQNEGFINIDSEPGHGTTFRIYLPRYRGEGTTEDTAILEEYSKSQGETILVVEDEVAVKDLTEKMLDNLGYKVITATTPNEAIAIVESYTDKIHLMIVDVVMPEMTGRELSERLKTLLPKLKPLFMSGYTADVIAHHGILDKNIHFIQKPFSVNALAVKVREALKG